MGDDFKVLRFFLQPAVREKGVTFAQPREGDAGFDISAACEVTIPVGGQALISTGLHIAVPTGWVGIVKDRSSMAAKRIYTHGGVIDAGYRGEVKIVLSNGGTGDFQVTVGLRIAQLVVVPALTLGEVTESLEELGDTARGHAGFGSSGR